MGILVESLIISEFQLITCACHQLLSLVTTYLLAVRHVGCAMTIAIFASRKTQRQYALTLSKYISGISGNKPLVLWYKDLINFKGYFKAMLSQKVDELDEAVAEILTEKRNHPKYRHSGLVYWSFLKVLKSLEARFLYSSYRRCFLDENVDQLIIWNGLKFRQRIAVIAAKQLNIPCYFIERGALPGTTTLDSKGINYINSVPRDPLFYLNRNIQKPLSSVVNTVAKENQLPKDYIFVPFQVNIDSQITMFSPWIENMFSLVDKILEVESILGEDMPNIVLKTHPACEQSYEDLFNYIKSKSAKVMVINDLDTKTLIEQSKAVMTINSSVGMEALLMRKKVIVLGQAFYNIQGITRSAISISSMSEEIRKIDSWFPNEQLTASFLDYLEHEYVVEGTWHEPDSEHLLSMVNRLDLLMASRVVRYQGSAKRHAGSLTLRT